MPRSSLVGLRGALVIAALIVLAACGLPQPFRHHAYAPDDNPLVSLRSGIGVAVPPVVGAPPPLNRAMAIEMADRLRTWEVPATVVNSAAADAPGLVLLGWLVGNEPEEGRTRLDVRWSLLASDGTVLDETTRHVTVSNGLWTARDQRVAALVASESRESVVGMIGPGSGLADEPGGVDEALAAAPPSGAPPKADTEATEDDDATPAPAAETPNRRAGEPARSAADLVMAPPEVTRAPGDGKEALERALTRIFEQNGVTIQDTPSPDRLSVRGAVDLLPLESVSQEQVTIVWELKNGDGDLLGRMTQENAIPVGSLDGPWGDVAALIAEGAVMGVGEILVRKGIVVPPGS